MTPEDPVVLPGSFMLLMQEATRQAKGRYPGRDSWSTSRAGLRFHNEKGLGKANLNFFKVFSLD